jgi:hypothetical protein
MKRMLFIAILATPIMLPMEEKAKAATEAFELAARKRVLEIKCNTITTILNSDPKPDKTQTKSLKKELKKSAKSIKALDKYLKTTGYNAMDDFMQSAKK